MCNLDVLSKQAFGVLGQELLVEEFTPCVLHLDSLKDSCLHNSDLIAAVLRPFLIDVWRKFCERRFPKETLENAEVRMAIDRAVSLLRRLPILSPNVRQQVNLVDCGLHTLANIEDLVAKQPRITASDLSSNPPCGLHFYEKDPNHRCRVQVSFQLRYRVS